MKCSCITYLSNLNSSLDNKLSIHIVALQEANNSFKASSSFFLDLSSSFHKENGLNTWKKKKEIICRKSDTIKLNISNCFSVFSLLELTEILIYVSIHQMTCQYTDWEMKIHEWSQEIKFKLSMINSMMLT